MNITSRIEGYETLTAEEKLAKLEALEIEEPKDNSSEIKKYKELIDKASSEASSWKKKYNEKLTEAEKNELERKEKDEALREELNTLRKEKEISVLEANYLSLGYSKELANDTANAVYSGDTSKAFENQRTFLAEREARLKEEILKNTPKPLNNPSGKVKSEEDKELDIVRYYAGLK